MTTSSDRFTPDEWSAVVRAPLLVAMAGVAGRRGAVRATLAVTRVYDSAREKYRTPLMRDVLATPAASSLKRPPKRRNLAREAQAAQETAQNILERAASPAERAEYEDFVRDLVARAESA